MQKVIWTPALEHRLCDMVATDQHSFGFIGKMMGLSRSTVTSRFTRITHKVGWQARQSHDGKPGDYVYPVKAGSP